MKEVYSLPNAKPYTFRFSPQRTALVVIDVQKDFVDPEGFGSIQCGSSEIFAGVRDVVGRIKPVLDKSRSLGLHVIHTREGHRPDLSDLPASKRLRQVSSPSGHHTLGIGDEGPMGRLLVRGEKGHGIVDELSPLPGEIVIDKSGKGSFWATDLHRKMMARGITHLLFAGVTTECCVTTTVREANDRGFECCILSECTGGFNENFAQTSLNMICSYDGLFGYVASSDDLLNLQRLNTSSTPSWGLSTEASGPRHDLSLGALRANYSSGSCGPVEVVHLIYDWIEQNEARYPNVWIHLRPRADVVHEASELAKTYHGKPLPRLYGIPFAVKDNYDVAGIPTTAACPPYTYTPTKTAPSVSELFEAGALLIGKTNMDQLATGLSGCRSPYGSTASVFGQSKYISGGSSSGSGVAVAARMVSFSLGTDTAGSGRVPASLNGIVGLKPTKGTLSARGVVPACKSLDTVSIFANCVSDARELWQAMDRPDPNDAYAKPVGTLPLSAMDFRGVGESGFTFAIPPPSALKEACSPIFQDYFLHAIRNLESAGGRLISISDAQYAPFRSANGLLYSGTLVNERVACIGHDFIVNNLEKLHPTTGKLFSTILNRDTRPWDVFKDQIKQAECIQQARETMECIGLLVLPGVPFHPTLEEMEQDPIGLNAQLGQFTHFGNVLDLCAINMNASWYNGVHGKMPFGISLVGGMGMDGRIMDIASHLEEKFSVN